jgi:hypothetical protein
MSRHPGSPGVEVTVTAIDPHHAMATLKTEDGALYELLCFFSGGVPKNFSAIRSTTLAVCPGVRWAYRTVITTLLCFSTSPMSRRVTPLILRITQVAILHAAIDETFLCVRRATGNKEMFDSSPMTCTAVKD